MTNEEIMMKEAFLPLYELLKTEQFVRDKSGVKMVELIAPRFELDPRRPELDFGARKTPMKYAEAELKWYDSMDLNVAEIGKVAKIWQDAAASDGTVNSNYGWCIYSNENGNQYNAAIKQLQDDSESRRSVMIYNRPSMQTDYNRDGMSDFMCTFNTQHFIRNTELIYIVYMRSNDAVYGFFNDFFWHCTVYDRMIKQLRKKYVNLKHGKIVWVASSFHVYERHFDMLTKIVEHARTPVASQDAQSIEG